MVFTVTCCRLTKKAEPPLTRDVNRDSGTRGAVAAGSGDWLNPFMLLFNTLSPSAFLETIDQFSNQL